MKPKKKSETLNMLARTMAQTTTADIEHDSSYWGDIAVSFKNGDQILLPVTADQALHIEIQLENPEPKKMINLISLDNRAIFINRSQVSDIYLSHDACDEFGPEGEIQSHYIFPPMLTNYWQNVDLFYYSEFDESFDMESLTANQRALWKALEDNGDEGDLFKRATELTWRLSSGKTRSLAVYDDELAYAQFMIFLENSDDENFTLALKQTEEARRVFVMPSAINYIWFPFQKLTNTMSNNS